MNSLEMDAKKIAREAGILYLLLAIFGAFGILYIPSLVVSGDAAATAKNILASESLFRLSFVSGLIGQTVFIVLVLVFYKLLKPVNKNHATLMVLFALVGIPIAMLGQLNQMAALILIIGPEYLSVYSTGQLQASAMFFLDLSQQAIFLVQIFWGLWLLPFGYLVFKSGFLPKFLGVLLILGCFGYLLDFAIFFLYPTIDATFSELFGMGEMVMVLWLLIKGVDAEKWEQRTLVSN